MTIMTAAALLDAVTELTTQSGRPLASGDEIYQWCAKNGVDWGEHLTPRGRYFWDADHANAPNVLRKFKKERVTKGSQNAWCLADAWHDACSWTVHQVPRWQAVPWSTVNNNWIWQCAQRVDATTSSFLQFDRDAIPCIQQHAMARRGRP